MIDHNGEWIDDCIVEEELVDKLKQIQRLLEEVHKDRYKQWDYKVCKWVNFYQDTDPEEFWESSSAQC